MRTVAGLFEDTIDAQRALGALRKVGYQPDQISFIVRDESAESGEDDAGPGAVARAVIASALETVGSWLQGLAELIVPNRGAFLVSGPLGAAVTSAQITELSPAARQEPAAASGGDGRMLRDAFDRFGFSEDESGYLERRLVAGNMLVAVTFGGDDDQLSVQTVLAAHEAVHIVAAESEQWVTEPIPALLEASDDTPAFIADFSVPFRRLCDEDGHNSCGSDVIDRYGEECGKIDELLANQSVGDAEPLLRYAIIGFGGILGIGRRQVALPIELVDLTTQPAQLSIDQALLQGAPEFDRETPFSRSEERQVFTYFGLPVYWTD
jgi:hypothetical protein